MSRPGALSTDVTGVVNVADDVVGFNVLFHIGPCAFLSTYFAGKNSPFLVSSDDCVVTDFHHRFDLIINLLNISIDKRDWHYWRRPIVTIRMMHFL